MQRGAKIALASGIVLTGLAGAAMFRKSPPPKTPQDPPAAAFQQPISRFAEEEPAPAAQLLGRIDPVRPAKTAAHPATDPKTSAGPGEPFDERHSPLEAMTTSPVRQLPKSSDVERTAGEPGPRGGQLHKVRDGDTLSSLARHYLGSSKRFLEIYEANREVLSNPDLLPIGAELKIPPADSAARPAAPAAPVDPPLTPLAARPVERPQASSGVRRTYRVELGDTLVAIAERFYGDGERYAEIYEANRQRLKTPADLREGLLLEIP